MKIRKTVRDDIDGILSIIEETRRYFRHEGIDQWQGEYPSRDVIERDISADESYVCEIDGRVCGFCAIVGGVDPSYVKIYEGEWKNGREYLALHRVAVSAECKGKGVAAAFVERAVLIAREKGILDIKCDTHEDNRNMRRMLEKNGFEYCGIIHLADDGAPRVAYQKII